MRAARTGVPPASSAPPVDAGELAVRAVALVKTYAARPDPVQALDGLSLSVGAGSVFALLGPNGAGKSTALKILTTLARPDSGSAVVAGHDVARHPERVRRTIGLVGQRTSADPMATGRENLVLAGRIQAMTRRDARTRAGELLARFDLTGSADRLARTYSGGMARKLDVAIGLMHRPAVLFLDEPTTGLDPQARSQLWAEITRLAAEEATTVLLTTQYLEEADQLAARVAIVDRGRLVVEGTPEQLKSELRGDRIDVEVAAGSAVTPGLLDRVAGLRDVLADGSRLRARADSGARCVPVVLAALESAGVAVTSVAVTRPSLDDVYLRHTGRAFEGAT